MCLLAIIKRACAFENYEQLKLFGIAFNGCGPVAIPALCRKKSARGKKFFLGGGGMNRGRFVFAAAPAAEIRDFQRFFNVQFAWLAGGVHAAKIVNAIGEVRIL